MDHGCCFTCGRDLTPKVAEIAYVQEEGCYGLFPEFWPHLDRDTLRSAVQTLRTIAREEVRQIVDSIPREWDVPPTAREALVEFICRRMTFVSDRIEGWIWPQREFDFVPPEGETT